MHHSPPEEMTFTVVVANQPLWYANYVSALAGAPTCKLPSSSWYLGTKVKPVTVHSCLIFRSVDDFGVSSYTINL